MSVMVKGISYEPQNPLLTLGPLTCSRASIYPSTDITISRLYHLQQATTSLLLTHDPPPPSTELAEWSGVD